MHICFSLLVSASNGFEEFTDNFELTLDTLVECNSHLIVVPGDINIKSKNLYINYKTTAKGAKIEFVFSQYAY